LDDCARAVPVSSKTHKPTLQKHQVVVFKRLSLAHGGVDFTPLSTVPFGGRSRLIVALKASRIVSASEMGWNALSAHQRHHVQQEVCRLDFGVPI
jgi:hypothetical protein